MPRPRTASDAEILEGAIRAISRVGPGRLTLTEVGREVGLSPATLLQRFGSKRGLLLALAEHAATSIDECFDAARRAADSPLGALLVAATDMAKHVESPEALANHLAFLQIDLSDPAFHTLALSGAQRTLDGYEVLLREAIRSASSRLARLGSSLARSRPSQGARSLTGLFIATGGSSNGFARTSRRSWAPIDGTEQPLSNIPVALLRAPDTVRAHRTLQPNTPPRNMGRRCRPRCLRQLTREPLMSPRGRDGAGRPEGRPCTHDPRAAASRPRVGRRRHTRYC